MNRLLTATDALSGVTTYTYDLAGRLTSITDPVSNTTRYTYDANGRQTVTTDPNSHDTTLTYDAAGQVVAKVDRNGRKTAYGYDLRGRQVSEQWLDAANNVLKTFTHTYDAAGQLIGVGDGTSALTYTYDASGRQTSVATSGSSAQPAVTLTTTYYDSGARAKLGDNLASVGTTEYSYDNAFRLEWISNNASGSRQTIDFGHDAAGRLTSIDRKLGTGGVYSYLLVGSTFSYDNADRPTAIDHGNYGSTLASYTYGYDNANRLTSETNAEGSVAYGYDNTDQLTGVSGARSESFSYDSNGNRTMTGYTTGGNNQLTSGAGFSYTYDNEGNLATKTDSATAAVWTYTWDYRNRLVGVVETSATNVVLVQGTYTYDPLDRRIGVAETVGSTSTATWTVYDGVNTYADFDGSGNLLTRYLYGSAVDEILARTSATGTTAWYLTDKLGSVRDLVDTTGTVIDHVAYDSYGSVAAESSPSNGDRFKYAFMEFDPSANLYFASARWYSPTLGRFVSEDPIGFSGRDSNLLRYTSNNPLNYVDITGNKKTRVSEFVEDAKKNGVPQKSIDIMTSLPGKIPQLTNPFGDNCQDYANTYRDKLVPDGFSCPPGIESVNIIQWGKPDGLISVGHAAVEIRLADGSKWYVDNGSIPLNGGFGGNFSNPADIPSDWVQGAEYPYLSPHVAARRAGRFVDSIIDGLTDFAGNISPYLK